MLFFQLGSFGRIWQPCCSEGALHLRQQVTFQNDFPWHDHCRQWKKHQYQYFRRYYGDIMATLDESPTARKLGLGHKLKSLAMSVYPQPASSCWDDLSLVLLRCDCSGREIYIWYILVESREGPKGSRRWSSAELNWWKSNQARVSLPSPLG